MQAIICHKFCGVDLCIVVAETVAQAAQFSRQGNIENLSKAKNREFTSNNIEE